MSDVTITSVCFFFLMIRRPPRSTLDRSAAASDVYKRQGEELAQTDHEVLVAQDPTDAAILAGCLVLMAEILEVLHRVLDQKRRAGFEMGHHGVPLHAQGLSLIHISEPTRPY